MDKERAEIYQKLSVKAEKWMFVYLGMGVAFAVSEYALYSVLNKITYLAFASIFAFAASLANHHMREWAKKKSEKYK